MRVYPGLPADRAGISGAYRNARGEIVLGDVITHLNNEVVKTNDDYLSLMERLEAGDTVVIKTRRGKEEKEYTLQLTESQ